MADQAGRIAVVTGGGRGLGRGVALGLAAAGASVVAVARNADQLRDTESMAASGPGSVTGHRLRRRGPRRGHGAE